LAKRKNCEFRLLEKRLSVSTKATREQTKRGKEGKIRTLDARESKQTTGSRRERVAEEVKVLPSVSRGFWNVSGGP